MEELPDSPPIKTSNAGGIFFSLSLIIAYFITQFLTAYLILKFYGLSSKEINHTISFSAATLNAFLWIVICRPLITKMDYEEPNRPKPTLINSLKYYGLGFLMMYGFIIAYGIILQSQGIELDKQEVAKSLQELGQSNLLLALLGPALLIPIIEELLFRGILFRHLKKSISLFLSIFISGVLFGLVHMEPAVFIPLIGLGIIFAWTYEQSGSIWVAIALHATNNFFSAIFLIYHDDIQKYLESVEKLNP
jgi:uncharacterized protein